MVRVFGALFASGTFKVTKWDGLAREGCAICWLCFRALSCANDIRRAEQTVQAMVVRWRDAGCAITAFSRVLEGLWKIIWSRWSHMPSPAPKPLKISGYKYRATFASYEKTTSLFAEAAHIWLNTLRGTSSVPSPTANTHSLLSTKHFGNRPITKNIAH